MINTLHMTDGWTNKAPSGGPWTDGRSEEKGTYALTYSRKESCVLTFVLFLSYLNKNLSFYSMNANKCKCIE